MLPIICTVDPINNQVFCPAIGSNTAVVVALLRGKKLFTTVKWYMYVCCCVQPDVRPLGTLTQLRYVKDTTLPGLLSPVLRST